MRHFTLGLFLVLTASFMMAQNSDLDFAMDKLSERGEIYFSFPVQNNEIMMSLTHQISIDGFKNGQVYAYANEQEFETFLNYGLEFTPVYDYYNSSKALTMATTVAQMAAWDRYPTHAVYEEMMQDFVDNYPGLARLETIGTSINGWPIICLVISDNVNTDEDEPEFWWSGTMHGDETTGYIMLLRMADYLLSNYGTDPEVTNLVENMEIYINPLANPDGTFNGSAGGTSVSSSVRYNANSEDLNRSFPRPDGGTTSSPIQPETQCMMDYAAAHDFVMSANTHGGTECVNYPWDTWLSSVNPHADNNWWDYVSFVYADQVEIDAPTDYFEGPGTMYDGSYNSTGVTHGADWYYAYGSRQDYMNYYQNIREVTLEISDNKTLGTEYLNTYWDYNKQAMLLYMEQCLYGLRGVVTDACTGTPLGDVKVEISGHDTDNSEVYSSAPVGNYHRPIYEGTYDFTFSLAGYQTQTHTVTITNDVSTRLDIQLIPDGTGTPDFTASPTSIFEGESVNFTDASSGTITSRSWTFEGGSPASSTDVNPAGISYATAGTYDVTLEIVSNGCTVSELKQDYITVAPAVPVVSNFIADQTTVPQGTTINFTDLSTNNPDDWSWTFDGGNPATSTDQNPSIVYNTPGTYDVVLTATNTYGGNTETKVGYITVTEADLLMSNGTATRCSGLFKDSGGDGQYENNENYTLTIYPSTPGSFVRLTFTEFDIEENTGGYPNCYDYLSIYDGENISATEIGSYCDVDLNVIGTNGVVTSTDPSGALTLNFSSDGGVVRDGWVAEISCYSPTDPPTANFTSDVTSTCTGIVQFEDLSTGATGWSWDFGDGNTSTEQDPQHTYTANGTYTVELTATNAYGTDVHEIIDMIVVDMPVAPVTTGAESCGEASLTISASGSGTLVWYDAATGGTEVTTGTSYTNTFSNTTTLYVQSEIDNTTTNYGGAPDNNYGTGGYFTNTNQHGLIFDTYQEFTLKSVKVYAQTAGDRTITLTDASDVEIQSTTINIPAGESRIDLNFDVPIGNGLKLMGPGSPNMYRNQTGSSYPYTLGGIFSINDNTAGNLAFYYYFYDWEVITGDYCNSSRTPVTATINSIPDVDAPTDVTACDSYILPALTNGDYFLSSGGVNPVSAGYEITGTTTVYVYAESGTLPNCTAENSFVVTINETPLVDNPDDVEVCDSYILPALTNGDYFLSSGGVDPVAAGYEITADEIVYVYSETGTTPNCTAENSFTVTINNAAQVDIGDNLTSACDGTVTLDAGTGYTSYTWQGVAGGQTYEATSTGIYTVVVEDANGCTSSDDVSVTIIESPTVSVTTTPESAPGANDGTATANPLGGTSPYSYTWQVPYPGNPTITGLSGGTYCVTVHDFNMCTATACGTVDTDGVAPVANFSADETEGCDNLTVQFTDESSNIPTSWEWDFGDGSPTNSEENPIHTYSAPGAYDVSLTVTNATGSDNTIEYSFIFVGETPSIDLSMTQANYNESNGSITVIATGGSTPYWYNWTGPNSFVGNNYTHADLPAGEYCVTVIENAANCEASDCIIITEIMPDPPVAAFSADVTEGCDNLTVQFTDESTNSPTTWAWDFGNGDTSDEQSPQYTYTTPGSYTVTLMVTNPGGSDDYFVTDMIVIGETPTLNLSMTEESLATGNDGTATVSITGGELPYDISWTGGFNTETITGLAAGEYCVTVIESAGCEAYDCINVALEGIDAPIANFSADETEACGSLTVQFTDLSANNPTTWEWDFGDGSATSSESNPSHTYSEPGLYTVSLTVTNLGGSNNLTLTEFIVVNEKPVLSFEISHESSTGAADGEITLSINGGTEPYTINWSNNMHDLTITNLNAGLYSVAVIDANGCLASSVAEVTVSTEITNTDIVNCNVYPNPSYGSFIVESNTIPEVISIKDALGRSIQTIYPIANKTEINLEMSPGIYFINLSIDDNMIIKKLIIK